MEVPDWFVDHLKRTGELVESKASRKPSGKDKSGKGTLRAFTVHPGWAWAIMMGVKKQEWRTFLPHPREGRCAIHVSKSYTRRQWEFEAREIRKQWHVALIPYEELVAEWCGRVVGICNYAASENDLDGIEYGWRLSDVKKLKNRIQCKGALKLWTMDEEFAKQVLSQL